MRSIVGRMKKLAEIVAVILMTAMFLAFLLQIFMRYVVNQPLPWTSEASVVFYIWVVFWGGAFLLSSRDHVAFSMVFDAVSLPRRRLFAIIFTLAIGAAFLSSLPAVIDYVTFMKIDSTPVTRIRFDYVYSIFVVFALAIVVRSIWALIVLLRPGWEAAVADRHIEDQE
jgi:TRAP-type C4-dicarboxylate transport system permease small subunit